MPTPTLPDDGYKVPDEPVGEEKYGDWTLRWSGWQQGVSSNGYSLSKQAWWGAFREGAKEIVVAFANGPMMIAKNGEAIPEHDGLSMYCPSPRIADRANALKAEAKARLLDALDRRPSVDDATRLQVAVDVEAELARMEEAADA